MCGRFALHILPGPVAEHFGLDRMIPYEPRYNIAPTLNVVGVRRSRETGERKPDQFRWGLIPSWAKDPKIGNRMINARAETVDSKPSFRAAFKRRRCIIPVSGWYEWRLEQKVKQPYFFHHADNLPLGLAGLWETWTGKDGSELRSCCLITTEPNAVAAEIHDRMPVALDPSDYDTWMDPTLEDSAPLKELLVGCPDEWINVYAVNRSVGNARNEGPGLIEPLSHGELF